MTNYALIVIMFCSALLWLVIDIFRRQQAEQQRLKDEISTELCKIIVATKDIHAHLNKPMNKEFEERLDKFLAEHQDKHP